MGRARLQAASAPGSPGTQPLLHSGVWAAGQPRPEPTLQDRPVFCIPGALPVCVSPLRLSLGEFRHPSTSPRAEPPTLGASALPRLRCGAGGRESQASAPSLALLPPTATNTQTGVMPHLIPRDSGSPVCCIQLFPQFRSTLTQAALPILGHRQERAAPRDPSPA